MRMRTQCEAYAEIKSKDPNTSLTQHALRQMILSGKIPTVSVGRKRLLDLDRLDEYLNASAVPENPAQSGVIRAIKP